MEQPTLRERKQQRAREAIVAAAFELFAERGYEAVTVTDIAERAEVGRTTFFRYFGDKQEVVFANERRWLDQGAERFRELRPAGAPSLQAALSLMRRITMAVCEGATRDPERYRARETLIAEQRELGDRAARKQRSFAELMTGLLREQGAAEETAVLAPQVALACYAAGRTVAGEDPSALERCVAAAFDRLGIA